MDPGAPSAQRGRHGDLARRSGRPDRAVQGDDGHPPCHRRAARPGRAADHRVAGDHGDGPAAREPLGWLQDRGSEPGRRAGAAGAPRGAGCRGGQGHPRGSGRLRPMAARGRTGRRGRREGRRVHGVRCGTGESRRAADARPAPGHARDQQRAEAARYSRLRRPQSSGKQRLSSVERRYPTPLEPPVPRFAPISRSTISTWR